MNIIFEQHEEEIRQRSIKELQDMMPGVFSTEEYENMFIQGLQGIQVLVNESSKLHEFMEVVQSFPSVSSEDMKLINMQLGLYSLNIQSKFKPIVANEDIDTIGLKDFAVENMNVAIVAAIATAIALIIKFWDRIFAFLFSPTEKSKKMAADASDMKKDLKAVNVKKYENSNIEIKPEEERTAYKEGKFISKSTFLHKYGKHGKGPYTNSQVLEAYDNYNAIAKDGGFADKVIDALYGMASFYTTDDSYKVLESIVDEIEKVTKLTPTIKNIDLKNVDGSIAALMHRYSTLEAGVFDTLLRNFPSKADKPEKVFEYSANASDRYGIFTNTYIHVKEHSLNFKNLTADHDIVFRTISSMLPGGIKNPEPIKIELPGPDDRAAATTKYLERFNASYGEKTGTFNYKGFSKHTEFQKGTFNSTMEKHSNRLKDLALRATALESTHQASSVKTLINASKGNIGGILIIVNRIFTDVYQNDIKDAEKLIKEIRCHDRDAKAK